MATIVFLSSSPPRLFAHSPTPADSSPSLPSPGAVLREPCIGSLRFKSADRTRDGVSGVFSNGRSMLNPKPGAENILVGSLGRTKFKQPGYRSQEEPLQNAENERRDEGHHDLPSHSPSRSADRLLFVYGEATRAGSLSPEYNPSSLQAKTVPERDSILVESLRPEVNSESGYREKALPRKLDWTPTKSAGVPLEVAETENSAFAHALMQSYTFEGPVKDSISEGQNINGIPLKRRRIDMLHTSALQTKISLPVTKGRNTAKQEKTLSMKKTKPSVKKALTITHLATTNYGEEHLNQGKPASMLEFLTATQVRPAEVCSVEEGSSKKVRPKPGTKKSRVSKKAPSKSRLVSPASAMKSLNDQSMIFGSASQLAREESPSLIRDTLKPTKQSELFLSSDNISPQRTQLTSIEASSQELCKGTSRYVKRRNLWAAAGRDPDNALLHVDTIDLSDSPAIRFAFAGKDVLLQPASVTDKKHGPVLTGENRMHRTPLAHKGNLLVDIDDITAPAFKHLKSPIQLQTRAYHTSASLGASRKSPTPVAEDLMEPAAKKALRPKSTAAPTKPSFMGLSDHDLQRQISAYGFKPIKKREKMIELLEMCWEDKYGPDIGKDSNPKPAGKETADAMTHADFLSKVHDVSTRPVPKVKKPRAKRKSENDPSTTPKEPKRRKNAEPKVKAPKEKAPKKPAAAKRKSKTSESSEEIVHDVDDIENVGHHESKPATEAVTKEVKAAKPKKSSKLAMPLPTLTPDVPSSPTFETRKEDEDINPDGLTLKVSGTQPTILSPIQTPLLPDLQSQIRTAIMFKNPPPSSHKQFSDPASKSSGSKAASSNHSKAPTGLAITPTWREKILMYDPIVLEDLTAWLNTDGFRSIKEDRQVTALDVRDWCEANGVCCYGVGGGWRGNGRKKQAPESG
ncbi:uncharacterized protein A1O9_07820 [Exophiala aquamarina CBS 119918]|uniref:Structure-specific endonuclease subunit SLX4 n=1 Tax=Exophiala aquamarina CBS 119918 TaxID=1182545 RepID=A0A072P813_9EURO|nr:uncharacterized protein A1O9_07820 [Exophiala aquamarina CBS 119918]KEF56239.1 hypothetical protein A1O9_07820 [Exophiala aquamarina CBS 119918]